MATCTVQSGSVDAGDGPALLAHGGAWDIPDGACNDHRADLRAALKRGRAVLQKEGSALEAVVAVVASMEASGTFDAGSGGMLRRDGSVELDAGLMDGATLDYGAVVGVQRFGEPIRLAHRLLQRSDGQARILTREGAEAFAEVEGFALVANEVLICERERRRYEHLRAEAEAFHTSHAFLQAPRGTVGCVARDAAGRLAAATSTGGTPFAPPGRVGDSPLPGAGFYANEHAAAGATGWGEAITAMRNTGRAVDAVAGGAAPESALRERLERMHDRINNRNGAGATGGLILLDQSGRGAWAFTTPRMARGGWQPGSPIWTQV